MLPGAGVEWNLFSWMSSTRCTAGQFAGYQCSVCRSLVQRLSVVRMVGCYDIMNGVCCESIESICAYIALTVGESARVHLRRSFTVRVLRTNDEYGNCSSVSLCTGLSDLCRCNS